MKEGQLNNWEKFEDAYIAVAECLMRADEINRAKDVLTKMLPSYYRDHPTDKIKVRLRQIHQYQQTIEDYATNPADDNVSVEQAVWMEHNFRAKIILKDVKELNSQGITPTIVEFGPGEYWLPILLHKRECNFKYFAIGVNGIARQKARAIIGDKLIDTPPQGQVDIFVACEVIEHLDDDHEIARRVNKMGITPKLIHMSTPRYTPHNGDPAIGWETRPGQGGHLRIYTPREFQTVVHAMFPEYAWTWFDNTLQHMRGELPSGSRAGFKTNGT